MDKEHWSDDTPRKPEKTLCEMRMREPLCMGEGRLTYRTDLALEYVAVKVSFNSYIVLSVD